METRSFAKIVGFVLLLAGALILNPSPSRADTVYSYTGVAFTSFTGTTCPPTCKITGSFAVTAPLASGITGMPSFTPTSFSFTDGSTTWTNLNTSLFAGFAVDTSAAGAIIAWNISLVGPGGGGGLFTFFDGPGSFQEGVNVTSYEAIASLGGGTPGTWTESTTTAAEPSDLLMLGLGLILLIALMLKGPSRGRLGLPDDVRL